MSFDEITRYTTLNRGTKSFSDLIDEWKTRNAGYDISWEYLLDEKAFGVKMSAICTEAMETVSAKEVIPDTTRLTAEAITFSLNILRWQIDLYDNCGIRI